MTTPKAVETVVVGGGIVGLASARALQRRGLHDVIVLEAETELGWHQTGHNSGVIHSGLYCAPGSVQARTCVRGRRELCRFAEEHGIAHRLTGKLVVATREEELPRLDALERRGRANGLEGLERLDASLLRRQFTGLDGIAALHVRETGIIDFRVVARVLAGQIREKGGRVLLGSRVVHVESEGPGLRIVTERGEIRARHLVGCAGLHADRLARACGLSLRSRIVPFRGRYYEMQDPPTFLTELPVYPVPDPALPFLGVHLTPRLSGRVLVGPSAMMATAREGYSATDVHLSDLAGLLGFPGFWRLAARHWKAALLETASEMSGTFFAMRARRLVHDLSAERLGKSHTGVRAQLVDGDGRLVDDFRILAGEHSLHVVNAPSPAATAALAIGEEVAERAATSWTRS